MYLFGKCDPALSIQNFGYCATWLCTRHTGFPGGQRFATPADYLAKKPTFLIEKAVKGMLPKTRLGEAIMKNLKVYAGAEHPHAAQNPKAIKLNEIK